MSPPRYDLDRVCTCIAGGGPSCVGRSPVQNTYCDADGGIDNQTVRLVGLIQMFLGMGSFGSAYFTSGVTGGRWSVLVHHGLQRGDERSLRRGRALPEPSDAGDAGMPEWEGSDPWYFSSTSFVLGDGGPGQIPEGDAGLVARYASNGAYVAGNTLVASLPQSEMIFTGAAGTSSLFKLDLSEGVFTGTLTLRNTDTGLQWSLENGIIAARWALTDIFDDLASYRDPSGNAICTGSIQYSVAKSTICNDADILVNQADPASTPCDALSFGLGFTADTATFGSVVDAGGAPDGGCPDASRPAGDFGPPP